MILGLIIILGLVLRLIQLDSLPGEMWGDPIEYYKIIQELHLGNFFWHYRFGGDGPLYYYVAAVITKIAGLSFYTIKLSSVLVGIAMIPLIYRYSLNLLQDRRVGLIAAFLAAVSFWPITASRVSFPYILIPVMLLMILNDLYQKRFIRAGLLIGLGLYIQATFWGLGLLSFYNKKSFLVSLLVAVPLLMQLPNMLTSDAYVGEKLGSHISIMEKGRRMGVNVIKNMASFGLVGDPGFRQKPPKAPHFDMISVLFLVIGAGTLFYQKKNKYLLLYLTIPWILAQIPSLLDIANYQWNPNIGRMIGVLPLTLTIIAVGIDKIGRQSPAYTRWFYGAALGTILLLNSYFYFWVYPTHLPNENVAFGRIIANSINSIASPTTKIGMYRCCWGEWGQPEENGVRFHLITPLQFEYLSDDKKRTAEWVGEHRKSDDWILIMPPDEEDWEADLMGHLEAREEKIEFGPVPVARIYRHMNQDNEER